MTTLHEAAQQALEALSDFARFQSMMMDGPDDSDRMLAEDYAEAGFKKMPAAIKALREALAQQPELSTASKSEQLLASHDHALRAEFQRMKAVLAQQVEQPYLHVYEYDSVQFGVHREFYPREWNGMKPTRTVPLYTRAAPAAQPVQPEPEPYSADVIRLIRDAGMTFHLGLPHSMVIAQMTRVIDLVKAEATIKAVQAFAAPAAQPTCKQDLQVETEQERYVRMCPDIECGRKKQCARMVGVSCMSRADIAPAAQGCDYCNHPLFAGLKCKNCGREFAPAAQHGEKK